MRNATRVLVLAFLGSSSLGVSVAGQSLVKPGTQIIPQGPLAPRVPQAQPQPTFEVICRGGPYMRLERHVARLRLFFSHSPVMPGADGSSLPEGTCSPSARVFALTEPPGIEFGAAAEYDTYQAAVKESDRGLRFVVSAELGILIARDHRSWKIPSAPNAEAARVIEQKPAIKETAKPEAAQKPSDGPPTNAPAKSDVPVQAGATIRNPGEKVTLNPQPLPPKATSIVQQTPVKAAPNPADRAVAKPAEKVEKLMGSPGPPPPRQPSIVSPATPIAGRAPTVESDEQRQQKPVEILCRGGSDLRIDRLSVPASAPGAVTLGVYFLPPKVPAGVLGRGLSPGTCSFRGDHVFGPGDWGGIQFETAANARAKPMLSGSVGSPASAAERFPDAGTIPLYLKDPAHYWRFIAVNTHRGFFRATEHQHWKLAGERIVDTAPDAGGDNLAVRSIRDVRVTPRDRSVRIDFIAAADATPSILIVKAPATVDGNGIILSWTGAPMAVNAQRAANTTPTVTRYVADSLVHRNPDPSHLSMLEPAAQYHYLIVDKNDPSRRIGGTFTTLAAGASGAPAPRVASGTPSSPSGIDDRGIIIVGGRDPAREQTAAARVTQEDINKGLPGPPPGQTVSRPAEQVDLSLQQLSSARVPPKTATSELNEEAYKSPMDGLIRKQEPRIQQWRVTPSSRGAIFEGVTEGAESELPFVEIGLGRPAPGANGYLAFDRAVARIPMTGTIEPVSTGAWFPDPATPPKYLARYRATIDGSLIPGTLYHYVITLPRGDANYQEYGTFATLTGPIPSGNARSDGLVATPPAAPPLRRSDSTLQSGTITSPGSASPAQLRTRESLARVRPQSAGALFTHAGWPGEDAYYRMRVQVSARPASVAASGLLAFEQPLADIAGSAKVETPRLGPSTYAVAVQVDGLAPATRYYYIVTLSNLRGAFHQERGTFTTLPGQE